MKQILLTFVFLMSGGLNFAFASVLENSLQTAATPMPTPSAAEAEAERVRQNQKFKRLRTPVQQSGAKASGRVILKKLPKVKMSQLPKLKVTDRDQELTSMNSQDAIEFQDFLKTSKTGFVRLHDASACPENVINVNSPCPFNIYGNATTYSFREKTYFLGENADIKYSSSILEILGTYTLGFLSNLGDIPLENLNLESKGIKPMVDFTPSLVPEVVKNNYLDAQRGFKIGDYVYKMQTPIIENNTYVLRSIAYRGDLKLRNEELKKPVVVDGKRTDIVIIFRVIRKHKDNSISILWKELQQKSSPTLKVKK